MRVLVIALLLLGAWVLHVASALAAMVHVTVVYPDVNLSPGDFLRLRGSAPLSWDDSAPLEHVSANTWAGSFLVSAQYLNQTVPRWGVDMKIIANEKLWQLGCNDRLSLTWEPLPPPQQQKHEQAAFPSRGERNVSFVMYPYFVTQRGAQTTVKSVFSPQLNNTRDVWVYVPPGSVENSLRIERRVLVMHDGQNLADLWKVPATLDQLIASGEMESVFVIGPYNTGASRLSEYTYGPDPNYGGGDGNLYLDFLEQTLLPLMRRNFRIETGRENLGLLGSSLGGLISCYAGVTRPLVYSVVGCMSSSFWWDYGNFSTWVMPKITDRENVKMQRYYLDSGDSGDSDDDRADTSVVASKFVRAGFELGSNFFWYLQRGGEHNEFYWASRFPRAMQFLYFRDALLNDPGEG